MRGDARKVARALALVEQAAKILTGIYNAGAIAGPVLDAAQMLKENLPHYQAQEPGA